MRRNQAQWFAVVLALGVTARAVTWWLTGGFHHPDEVFQYLEPANYLRTGVAWLPWEFGRGVRSWIPPGYYAALLEVFSWVGLEGLAAQRALALHNALFTLLLIPAAYRAGLALGKDAPDDAVARWSATFAAVLPALVYFTPHTLIGTPSSLALSWGWVFWLEARQDASTADRRLLWCGLMFGVAGSLRFIVGFHMLVPLADLLIRYRGRAVTKLAMGAAAPVLLFGFVDWLTWGTWFHSTIEYVKYNYFEGAREAASPWYYYLTETHWKALGPLAVAAIAVALASLRTTWILALTIVLPTVALSTVSYNAHRLLMANWFVVAIMLGAGIATLAQRVDQRWHGRGAYVGVLLAVAILASNAKGIAEWPWTWRRGIFHAQDFVGKRDDATGLLFDGRQHLNGGHLVLQRTIPQAQYRYAFARRGPFNYAALAEESDALQTLKRRGWIEEAQFDEIVVLRRPDATR